MKDKEKSEVFGRIKSILKKNKGKLSVKTNTETGYHLYSVKKIKISHREYNRLYFAGLTVNTNDVSFYFFPLYINKSKFRLSTQLKNKLKGKTCFHFRKIDDELLNEVTELVIKGYSEYKKAKWI